MSVFIRVPVLFVLSMLVGCGSSDNLYTINLDRYESLLNEDNGSSVVAVKGDKDKNSFAGMACPFIAMGFVEEVLQKEAEAKANGTKLSPQDLNVDNPTPAVFSLVDGKIEFQGYADVFDRTEDGKYSYGINDLGGDSFLEVDSADVTCSYPLNKV